MVVANPFGPPVRGWDRVSEALDYASSRFRDGRVTEFETVARYVGADLASSGLGRTIAPIPDGVDQVALIEQTLDEVKHLAGVDGVHTTALAFDPLRWHTVRFTLWEHAVPADEPATERYEVLHLSAPELDAIPSGRHW